MRRTRSRGITVAVLAATTMVGACTDMYLDRPDTVSFEASNASAANKAIQTIDPSPVYGARQDIADDGERAAAAAERYRTNKVTQPTGIGTSSVKYDQPAPQPVAK